MAFDPGIDFGLLRLAVREAYTVVTASETVIVLLGGKVRVTLAGQSFFASRASCFDEAPWTFHCGAGAALAIESRRGSAELAVIRAENPRTLPIRLYAPTDVVTEDRGAGLAQGACRRLVRTIFDHGIRPDSNLVVGEVVNFPGRWSSYPGHHHAQPEVYHYRFTRPQGYGHAELGEEVFKVHDGDTVAIPGGLDHAQVSAPGYGMYYLWIVRHLPRQPYRGFTFSPEHKWLLDPAHQGWQPPLVDSPR
jgi:5-deoxy-glucuronate isomerase